MGQVLRTMFPGRLISHFRDITWPVRSPDLAVTDYFLWGYITSKLYEIRPDNTDDLRHRILERIQRIPKEKLQHVTTAFPSWLQECIEQHGGLVTIKVSYSNNNDWDEFSWIWNAPNNINKIFPLFLKKLFHLKKRHVFMTHPALWDLPLINFHRILSTSNLQIEPAHPSLLILTPPTTFISLHEL